MPSAPARSHDDRPLDRVGIGRPARLAHRRDVVDVDVETLVEHLRSWVAGLWSQGVRVRKVITAVLALSALAACSSAPTPPAPSAELDARVQRRAGRTRCVERGARVHGRREGCRASSRSPCGGAIRRDRRATASRKDELEKRELIMLKCLKHDRYTSLGEAPATRRDARHHRERGVPGVARTRRT